MFPLVKCLNQKWQLQINPALYWRASHEIFRHWERLHLFWSGIWQDSIKINWGLLCPLRSDVCPRAFSQQALSRGWARGIKGNPLGMFVYCLPPKPMHSQDPSNAHLQKIPWFAGTHQVHSLPTLTFPTADSPPPHVSLRECFWNSLHLNFPPIFGILALLWSCCMRTVHGSLCACLNFWAWLKPHNKVSSMWLNRWLCDTQWDWTELWCVRVCICVCVVLVTCADTCAHL